MNARFVTLVLLLFVWLEGDSVWAQYLPKLYQVFSPDKKLKMAIQRHNDGLLTYTFAANREILIKESPLGFKLESQETVPSSGWKIEKVSDRKVRDEWKPLWGKRAVVHFSDFSVYFYDIPRFKRLGSRASAGAAALPSILLRSAMTARSTACSC